MSVVDEVASSVRKRMEGETTGHDWWHVSRVLKLAEKIASREGECDLVVVRLAALLHDIADWKFSGSEFASSEEARKILSELGLEEEKTDHVCSIIDNLSFKGAKVENRISTKEGMIVQDADRLDAIGAIGIARAFAYGGMKGRMIHDPSQKPWLHPKAEDYRNNSSSTVIHFHEKLLLLKDRMNTQAGRDLAEQRHTFTLDYIKRFMDEWDGI